MSSEDNDHQGVVWAVLIGVILLAVSLAIGIGLYRTGQSATGASGAVMVSAGTGGDAGADAGAGAGAGASASASASASADAGAGAGAEAGAGAGDAASAPVAADAAPAPAAAGAAGAAAADPAVAVADGASVRIEDGVVKFYFASGSAELAADAPDALADIVKGVAAGQTAVISGYHDTTGDQAQNEELAKQRAFAVRDALMALGIGEDKLELKKPELTTADGSNAEARRVEVSLQ